MFDYGTTELATIDENLEPKLAWAKTRFDEVEQLALDSARILSCTEDRLQEYTSQGFFKRCWTKLSGKQGAVDRANQRDLVEMQKIGWRYINLLSDRDMLLAHTMITLKNSLVTLYVEEEKTRAKIRDMAEMLRFRYEALGDRMAAVEATQRIHGWLLTIDTLDYDESNHLADSSPFQ